MSIRGLLNTDETQPDYGKINSSFLPSTHPPVGSSPIQSAITAGLVRMPAGQPPQSFSSYNPYGGMPMTQPSFVGELEGTGTLLENLTADLTYSSIIIRGQIIFNNIAVQFIDAPDPVDTPPVFLAIQFYVENQNEEQQVFPQNGITTGTNIGFPKVAPVAILRLQGQADTGVAPLSDLGTNEIYLYSGVGFFEDYIPYSNYDNLQLSCMIMNGNNMSDFDGAITANTLTGTEVGTPPATLPASQVGQIQYTLSIQCAN